MSLPPRFLEDLRSRLSLSQVVGRKVSWDTKKSNQGRGDMWAPCPFHQEKTASFHVDDRKGFYYCFGCHEKGDAINFVMATENLSFMEAVRLLADEAGVPMPDRDPRAREVADRNAELLELVAAAQRHFGRQLRGQAGARARDYLAGRGLDPQAQERWGIGYAPDGWQVLRDHMAEAGIKDALMIEAGLAAESRKGGAPYDVFRDRIIFPIADPRGRVVAFGGRAMAKDAQAKYLNSPETPLFDKGRTLFNHANARKAAGAGTPLVVAEGYMDVIALSEAGFGAAVAPLGTAITEDQLRMIWRIDPDPVIALDGDTAGTRAALRLVDLALPLIEAGQSLRFLLLPEGQDPDDYLKASGPDAMRGLIDAAEPMVDLLWRRETADKVLDSPERRAALDKSLRAILTRISDPSIRRHYGEALRDRRRDLFKPARVSSWRPGGGRKTFDRPAPAPGTRASVLAGTKGDVAFETMREITILAVLVRFGHLVPQFEAALEATGFRDPDCARIAAALLRQADAAAGDMRGPLSEEIAPPALEKVLGARHLTVVPALRSDDPEAAALCVAEEFAKLAARRGVEREIEEAIEDVVALSDETVTWRLRQAAQALDRAGRGDMEDRTEYDLAPNGVRLNRSERDALNGLLSRIRGDRIDRQD